MQTNKPRHRKLKFLAVLVSACLFTLAHPNIIFENGLAVLAFVMYVPVIWLIKRVSLPSSVLYGALYGALSFSLLCYWVNAYHLIGGITVSFIYMVFFAILFPLLKLSVMFFPNSGYILQWLIWISFEYLRTKGFLGFSYGITGYTQWQMTALIQIANIFGVWGVSALVIFPSMYVGNKITLKKGYGSWHII